MFKGCKSLSLLNLNHFNTTKVQYMNKMFENCQNLTQLNISQISSNSLSSMYRMFYNCKSLEYLNIYNLTEDAQSITEMFEGTPNNFIICIKDKENIPNIYNLIYNKITRDCKSSCYGIGNERNSSQNNKSCCTRYEYNNECYNKCPSKTKIQDSTNICKYFNCIYSFYNYEQNDCNDSIPDGFYQNDTDINTIDKCHEDCKTCKIGPNDYSTNCLICNDNKPYVYLGNCYANCRYGDFIDSNKINKCKCHRTKCEECTRESLKYDLCVSCNEKEGYYEKLNDSINISTFKNCYKDPEKYYLNTQKKYIPCYHSCKSCAPLKPDKKHHYCKSCNEDNSFSISDENNSTYMNCYPECKYNYYFNETEDYNYTCTKTPNCPQSYPFLIENTKQCIETCQNFSKIWQFRHTCFEQCPNDSKNYTNSSGSYCNASCPFEKPFEMVETQYCLSNCTIMDRYNKLCFTNYDGNRNSEVQDMVLSDFKADIIDTFDYTIINESHNIIHEEKNVIYEITSTNCTFQDLRTTTIDLGECEYILKDYYGFDANKPLYIFKIDAFVEGKIGPKVEYEVYYPSDGIHLHQLDLSICEGKEIFIGYIINITEEELDLYNNDSPYYNDLCYTYTNSKGTDVTLNDRQIEYINNNKSLCEENCKPSRYEKEKERLICSCEIKSSISIISQIKVDKNKLYKFIDLKQMANFKVMKCINLLLSIKGFKDNIGFYSFIPTLLSYIISLFVLVFIEFKKIKKQIHGIISAKKFLNYSKDVKGEQERKSKRKKHKQKSVNNILINEGKIKYFYKKTETIIGSPPLKKYKKKRYEKKSGRFYKKHLSKQESKLSLKNESSYVFKLYKTYKKELTKKQIIKIAEILKYNDNELNELGYKKAFKYDNRTFFQYYFSLLFTKHILFQIFNRRDYNAYSIKVLLLFFNFSSCYAVNALFFNDNTMHQIYEDEGNFNFIYQLPQIAYSTLISFFIDSLTTFLALSENYIIKLKKDKNFVDLKKKSKHIKTILKIKFIFFFLVNIIFILVFWYYLSCFCAVYKNTQYHLIKDTLISFGISYVTPFGTNILTAFIRIYSLRKFTKANQMLFRLSRILQHYL